jgi:uncharacterized membrane protein
MGSDVTTAAADRARLKVAFAVLLVIWALIHGTRAILWHLALRTNAYDLSVFDYALWSTGHGRLGYVPFIRESLMTRHVMPTLALLLPPYQLWPSPWLLIALQLGAFAGAAILLYRLLPDDLPAVAVIAILIAFLFGRRSHVAVTSFYYVESLEPLLVFAALLLWRAGRRRAAMAMGLLALGCKEDMGLYCAAFGGYLFFRRRERAGIAVALVGLLWVVLSVWVVIPAVRHAEGLPPADPFVGAPQQTASAARALAARTFSAPVATTVFTLTSGVGFLCWLAPAEFAVAIPGLLLTMLANPHTRAIGVSGHYLFPILPWLFYAGACGASSLHRRAPGLLTPVCVVLIIGIVADTPLWRGSADLVRNYAAARPVRGQLALIPGDASLAAMPNLVPHVAHRVRLSTIESPQVDSGASDYVALTLLGDTWPLSRADVAMLIRRYQSDARFVELCHGPAFVYKRR